MTEPRLVSLHRATGKVDLLATRSRITRPLHRPTREQPLIISASELRDFLRCRVKWWWRHQARLEPRRGGEALALGSLVHNVLEQYYHLVPGDRTVKRMEKIAATLCNGATLKQLDTADRQLAEAMCIGYAAWAKTADKEIGLRDCFPEQMFRLPLVPDGSILVSGRIDLPFKSKVMKKTMGMREFKTAGQMKHNVVEMNLQLTVYLWAMRELYPGFKRYEAHYTQLRKQMPGPRVKADLFASEAIARTDEEIEQWKLDTANIAMDMLDAAIYPTPDDSCSWGCDFQKACLERGNPGDLKHILKSEYQTKEYRP